MPRNQPLTAREEAFAKEVVLNGGDKVAAFKAAGYSWKNYKPATLATQADKIYNKPKINLKIKEWQNEADKTAKCKFRKSVDWRLQKLSEVVEAGLGTYTIMEGLVTRYENLPAAVSAIKTMNEMLGVNMDEEDVKPVKVIIGVQDASKPE